MDKGTIIKDVSNTVEHKPFFASCSIIRCVFVTNLLCLWNVRWAVNFSNVSQQESQNCCTYWLRKLRCPLSYPSDLKYYGQVFSLCIWYSWVLYYDPLETWSTSFYCFTNSNSDDISIRIVVILLWMSNRISVCPNSKRCPLLTWVTESLLSLMSSNFFR